MPLPYNQISSRQPILNVVKIPEIYIKNQEIKKNIRNNFEQGKTIRENKTTQDKGNKIQKFIIQITRSTQHPLSKNKMERSYKGKHKPPSNIFIKSPPNIESNRCKPHEHFMFQRNNCPAPPSLMASSKNAKDVHGTETPDERSMIKNLSDNYSPYEQFLKVISKITNSHSNGLRKPFPAVAG